MTERIDIEVKDGIDASIPKRLRDIASGAREAHGEINNLQQALAGMGGGHLDNLSKAAKDLESQLKATWRAQGQLNEATFNAQSYLEDAAKSRQDLTDKLRDYGDAVHNIAAREVETARVASKALTEQEAAASRALRTKQREQAAAMRLQQAEHDLAASKLHETTVTRQLELAELRLARARDVNTASMGRGSAGARVLTRELRMLAGAQATGFGGEAARLFGGAVFAFPAMIAAVATLGAGFVALNEEVKRASNENVKFQDTFGATFQVIRDRLVNGLKPAIDNIAPWFSTAYDKVKQATTILINGVAVLWSALFGYIGELPGAFVVLWNTAYNEILNLIQGFVNVGIDAVNTLISAVNNASKLLGQQSLLDPITHVDMTKHKAQINNDVKSLADVWNESVERIRANGGVASFFDDVVTQAGKNARKREMGKFDRAGELKKITDALDAQTRSMTMLADARRVQEQLDQIALNFAQNKAPLDAQEIATLRQKIAAIQAYARVQKETDRIVEETKGTQQTYAATIQAAGRLLKDGTIDQERYNREIRTAEIVLQRATNPLYEYEQALASATRTLGYYGTELVAQQAVESIVQAQRQKGIELTQDQINTMLQEQRVLQEGIRAQQALSSVYESVTGAQRTYQLELAALNTLYADNAITAQQYQEAVNRVELAHTRATNPLYDFNRGLEEQRLNLSAYGEAQAVLNNQLQAYNALLEAGSTNLTFAQFQQTAQAQAIAQTTLELEKQARVHGMLNGILNEIQNQRIGTVLANEQLMYDELKRLRDADLLSHEQYERAKVAIAIRANEERLNNYRAVASAWSGLMSANNKKLFAIGKAAAIAQATIDGFLAVQRTLATVPPPFNYAAAAGIAATTAVNVANIKAQQFQGGYQHGGQFTVGGRAGIDTNLVGMSLTKGERVTVETAAQARAADRGQTGGGSTHVEVPVKVVNVIDPQEALAAMQTPEGEAVVLNILRRNPEAVKQAAQGVG